MKLLFVCSIVAASAFAARPVDPLTAPLVLHTKTGRVVIPQRNTEGQHNFRADSCRGFIAISVLHSAIHRGDTLYLVFTCAGWSRGPMPRGGRCGSGWERQINWMAIRKGIVIDHRQRDIESCWQDAGGSIDGWHGTKLVWRTDERDGTYTCFFDSALPEAAIQIQDFTALPKPETAR